MLRTSGAVFRRDAHALQTDADFAAKSPAAVPAAPFPTA